MTSQERCDILNYRRLNCLANSFYKSASRKTLQEANIGPLWREFTMAGVFPRQKASYTIYDKSFYIRTSSCLITCKSLQISFERNERNLWKINMLVIVTTVTSTILTISRHHFQSRNSPGCTPWCFSIKKISLVDNVALACPSSRGKIFFIGD